jgi:hypothetical protein
VGRSVKFEPFEEEEEEEGVMNARGEVQFEGEVAAADGGSEEAAVVAEVERARVEPE